MTKYLLSTEKLFVFEYCFTFIVLGQNTSKTVSSEWKDRYDKSFTGGRGLTVCCAR